jgi:hypothetical protein
LNVGGLRLIYHGGVHIRLHCVGIPVGRAVALPADALLAKKAVHRRAAPVVAMAPIAPTAAAVIDNNYGPVADRIPRCIDSAILYPYPPCY